MHTPEPPAPLHRSRFGRRTFVVGAVAGGLATVLAACSDESDDTTGDTADGGSEAGASGGTADVADDFQGDSAALDTDTFTIIKRFPEAAVPGRQRLPISLSTGRAELISDGPLTLGAAVTDLDGNVVVERVTANRRDVTPSSYYDFVTELDEPGIYQLVVDGGPTDGASFQVFEPGQVAIPVPGDRLVGLDTPTPGDGQGVDPICTREPECPFHSLTLAEALSTGVPVAFLVGTPAFCSTGTCTPALEALIEASGRYGDRLVSVHAEVYTDLTATEIAPAVTALGLNYEPVLFITDAEGIVVERLDAIWNLEELTEHLDAVVA